jgi:hypothetical protein
MPVSQDTIRAEAYKYLNESNISTLGQFPNGQGGTTTAGDTYANSLILEGIADLCRSCVYFPSSATVVIATATNTKLITDSRIWFPTDVYNGSTRLTHTSEPSLRANDLSYKSTTASTSALITHWYRADNYAVSVYPGNATGSNVSLTVYGASIPADPGSTATAITFLPDDLLTQLLASYTATRLVMKNIDDPSVAQRMFWRNWYDEGRMKLYARLDAHLRNPNGPFSMPPVAPQESK